MAAELNRILLKSPVSVSWDLTHHCPLNCIYCYNDKTTRSRAEALTQINADRISKEIVRAMPLNVCLSGGEPLSYTHIQQVAGELRKHNIALSILTSGWLEDYQTLEWVSKTFSLVQVNIDGATCSTHDRIRGREGSYERAIKTILSLRELGFNNIRIVFVLTRLNISEFPQFAETWSRMDGIKSIVAQRLILKGRAAKVKDLEPTFSQWSDFCLAFDELRYKQANVNVFLSLDPFLQVRRDIQLGMPLAQIHIATDGLARPHPLINIVLGDINKYSLEAVYKRKIGIWRSKKTKLVMEALIAQENEKLQILSNSLSCETSCVPPNNSLSIKGLNSFGWQRRPKLMNSAKVHRAEKEAKVMITTKGGFIINATASLILDLCDGNNTMLQILETMKTKFPGTSDRMLAKNLEKSITEFEKSALISLQ